MVYGAPIGLLIQRPRFATNCSEFCPLAIVSATLALVASEAALEAPDSYLENVEEYRRRRSSWVLSLNKLKVWYPNRKELFFNIANCIAMEETIVFAESFLIESNSDISLRRFLFF